MKTGNMLVGILAGAAIGAVLVIYTLRTRVQRRGGISRRKERNMQKIYRVNTMKSSAL